MLADLLADPVGLGEPVSGAPLRDARNLLEQAAGASTRDGGWSAGDPLRLSKRVLGWLLRCPRRAVAGPEALAAGTDAGAVALGMIVDAGAKLATLTGRRQPVTVDDAVGYLQAAGEAAIDDHLAVVAADPRALADLRAEAGERLRRLTGAWPACDPAWWPRVEDPVRLRLAGGAVTLTGKLDIVVGGPPTGRPGLVIEVKSGRWHDAARSDAQLYGLLLGLRDGTAPAAVLTVSAADGATQLEPIRPAVIGHTAERVAVAMGTAASLAAGEPPATRPGSHCATCPLEATCPAARTARAAEPAA